MKALVNAYPNTLQAYHWASLHAHHTDKDNDSAIKYAQQLIAMNPEIGPIYNTTGYIYLDRKEMMKARTAFEDYIAYSANEANPYDSMADYYMANKEYEKAAVFYEKAVVMGMSSAAERAKKAKEMITASVKEN